MASTTLKVGYRPLRVGFCVNPQKLDEVREAIRLSTILWGGIYNPIIPIINTKEDFAKQLVNIFQVDLLYPLNDSVEVKNFIESHKHLQWPHFQPDFYQQDDKGLKPTLLDVSNIITYYWENEFKSTKRSNCMLPEWQDNDALASVFAANFGEYPNNKQLLFDYRQGFKNGLRAKSLTIEPNKVISTDLCKRITPALITDTLLELSGSGWGWTYHGIYLGEHDNPEDLINFWNLRACAMDLYFVPIKGFSRLKTFAKKHIDGVAKRTVSQKFQTGAAIWYRDAIDEETVRKLSDSLFKKGVQRTHCRVNETSWNGLNVKPFKAHFETKSVLANIEWRQNKPSIAFQLPEKIFKENRYNNWQKLALMCDPIVEFGYPDHTLTLPYLTDLNEWYGREIVFDPFDFRVGKGDIGKIIDVYEETAIIDPISNKVLIKKLFSRAEIQAKDSQAGLITQRLIEQMGELDACRVFQVTGVRKLIDSSALNSFVTRGNATKIIWDLDEDTKQTSFERHKSLHIQQRNAPELTTEEVFDYLIEKNVFRVGLEPECPNCGLKFWLGIKDATDEVRCEYCGFLFKLGLQLKHRGDWKFRRSGLFGKDNNQEGAIPVVLALMQLMRRSDRHDNFICSTALKLDSSDGINCETDLVVVHPSNEGVDLVIGECKSNNFEITEEDVQNLTRVKQKMENSGSIKVYLLFAKTSAFSFDEINRFKQLKTQGIIPILFSDQDLEPYDAYMDYSLRKVKLPEPYTHNFEGMAKNSDQLYLQ